MILTRQIHHQNTIAVSILHPLGHTVAQGLDVGAVIEGPNGDQRGKTDGPRRNLAPPSNRSHQGIMMGQPTRVPITGS